MFASSGEAGENETVQAHYCFLSYNNERRRECSEKRWIRDGCLLPDDRRQDRRGGARLPGVLIGEPECERNDKVERDWRARETVSDNKVSKIAEITCATH